MDPNQQPQDFNKQNKPTEAPDPQPVDSSTGVNFPQSNPAPEPTTSFSASPEAVSNPVPTNTQPFEQPTVPNQPVAPQPFSSPETPGMTQAPIVSGENPGQTLGIISIVLSVIGLPPIGLILGIVSRKKSKIAGASTTLGTVGMVMGIVLTVLYLLIIVPILIAITFVASDGIQERAASSESRSAANSLAKRALIYENENGTYPESSSDIDTTSFISNDIVIITSTPSTYSQLQYVKCDDEGAQVLYLGNNREVEIVSLGEASATTPC